MKNNLTTHIPFILLFIIVFYSTTIFSQVKIGDNPKSMNTDAMLEVESSNKGILLTRIALRSTLSPTPLKIFTAGMIVYNTATINDVTPGLYYCDGKKWTKANTNITPSDSVANQNVFWGMKGNNNVTTNNFLGSTNSAPMIIKTTDTERLRITE